MKKITKTTTIATAIVLIILFIVSFLINGVSGGATLARAATETVSAYERRNVMDDLKNATIDGKPIDLTTYNFDKSKNVQVLSFIEFGYSPRVEKLYDYGLYIYVYNPKGLDWTKNESLNRISFKCESAVSYSKYKLKYLNRSETLGYEGIFYKFKVELSEGEKDKILYLLNSAARVYNVSEIELYDSGENAEAYGIGNTYTYTGYAAGYGSDSAAESSLNCKSDGLITLTLDVHSTFYRPEGNNGVNRYTQDMLHSVYFSIPNEIIAEYGDLTAVHATWLNAVTAPIFVTGNKNIYDALYKTVWEQNGEPTDLDYCWAASARQLEADEWYGDFYYGDTPTAWHGFIMDNIDGEFIENLRYLYYASNGVADLNSADHYVVRGTEILNYLVRFTEEANKGGTNKLVADKYSEVLFESYDEEFTDVNISAEDKRSLTSQKLTETFWEKIFGLQGTQITDRKTFSEIDAIYKVTDSDFKSDIKSTCDGLYIYENDYYSFKEYFESSKKSNKTTYLFRYYQSEYECREVTQFEYKTYWGKPKSAVKKLDTNAYLAKETVNLDFDIIDVTCSKGEIDTVIPVVSSPIDIIPDVTPPLEVTTDPKPQGGCNSKMAWWAWVLIGIAVIAVILLLPLLLPLIWKLISFPFRQLKKAFGNVNKEKEKRRAKEVKQRNEAKKRK